MLDWHTPPAYVVSRAFALLIFSLSHGSWERDTRRMPGSGSGLLSHWQSPYLTLKSE